MYNRVSRVLIGDGVNSAALSAIKITDGANIAAGDLVLVKADMTVVQTNAAAQALSKTEPVYIAMGTGAGEFRLSSPIYPKNVISFKGKAYAAPAEQVSYLGFNGTDGTISVSNSTEYVLRMILKDDLRVQPHRQTRNQYHYVTDSTATVVELISALTEQAARDVNWRKIKAEMVTDGTFGVLGGSSTLAVTKGSKKATASSGSHGLVAGDLVRIGGTGATVPVYEVESIATTTIYFKVPYQGTTETVANASVGEITGAANYGIKLTGVAIDFNGIDYYQKVSFDASLAPINGVISEATQFRTTTKMSKGIGFYQQIRDMEYHAQGHLGVTNRTVFPNDELQYTSLFKYNSAASYHIITIEHDDEHTFFLENKGKSPVTTVIAIPQGHQATLNAQVVDGTDENFAYTLAGLFTTALGLDALPAMT
jgi:type 1 fimbria pilin